MGFVEVKAVKALAAANGDVNVALDFLTTTDPDDDDISQPAWVRELLARYDEGLARSAKEDFFSGRDVASLAISPSSIDVAALTSMGFAEDSAIAALAAADGDNRAQDRVENAHRRGR